MTETLYGEATGKAVRGAFAVQRERGYGFLEKAYQNAMVIELGI